MIVKKLYGPATLSDVYTTDIYVPGSALVYDVVRHIHIANRTAGAVTFRIYLGATGANTAGTELWFDQTVAAHGVYDWYGMLKLVSTTYLVGGASAPNALTITIMGDSVVV